MKSPPYAGSGPAFMVVRLGGCEMPPRLGLLRDGGPVRPRTDPELVLVDQERLAIVPSGERAEPQGLRQPSVGALDAELTLGGYAVVAGGGADHLELIVLE